MPTISVGRPQRESATCSRLAARNGHRCTQQWLGGDRVGHRSVPIIDAADHPARICRRHRRGLARSPELAGASFAGHAIRPPAWRGAGVGHLAPVRSAATIASLWLAPVTAVLLVAACVTPSPPGTTRTKSVRTGASAFQPRMNLGLILCASGCAVLRPERSSGYATITCRLDAPDGCCFSRHHIHAVSLRGRSTRRSPRPMAGAGGPPVSARPPPDRRVFHLLVPACGRRRLTRRPSPGEAVARRRDLIGASRVVGISGTGQWAGRFFAIAGRTSSSDTHTITTQQLGAKSEYF